MQNEKLIKKGQPAKAEDGSIVLVNEDKQAYSVSEVVLTIWNMCDGKSFNQIANEINSQVKEDETAVKQSLEQLFSQLQDNKLLEIKPT